MTGLPYSLLTSWITGGKHGTNWIGPKDVKRIWTKCQDADNPTGCVISEVSESQETIMWNESNIVDVTVKDHDGKRKIGTYNRDTNTFEKYVKDSHRFLKHDAWGLDAGTLEKMVPHKTTIVVKNPEEGASYITTATEWKENGIKENYGHGTQYFLPRAHFKKQSWNKTK